MQLHILIAAFTILQLTVSPSQGYMLSHIAHLQGYFFFLVPLKTEVTAILPKDQAAFLTQLSAFGEFSVIVSREHAETE